MFLLRRPDVNLPVEIFIRRCSFFALPKAFYFRIDCLSRSTLNGYRFFQIDGPVLLETIEDNADQFFRTQRVSCRFSGRFVRSTDKSFRIRLSSFPTDPRRGARKSSEWGSIALLLKRWRACSSKIHLTPFPLFTLFSLFPVFVPFHSSLLPLSPYFSFYPPSLPLHFPPLYWQIPLAAAFPRFSLTRPSDFLVLCV